jgi:SAM-dependent methyltransferase
MELKIKIPSKESRKLEQIYEHYALEKQLALRLLNSKKEERKELYTQLYDELYQTITHHPRWTRKSNAETTAWIVERRLELLQFFLKDDITYLEIGPGDCSLAIAVSQKVAKVYAVDVATEVAKHINFPQNVEFIVSDGCSIPVPPNSVDLAYSHQLMEHLHPDDALEQLQNIYNALMPGGQYICITPNRLSGPHDISKYFEELATGFHLKEYTVSELYQLFHNVGFNKIFWIKNQKNLIVKIPLQWWSLPLIRLAEMALQILPFSWRNKIANNPLLFRGMTIVGIK